MGLSQNMVSRLQTHWAGSEEILIAGPANAAAVAEIRDYVGFELSPGYLDFVARYGGAIVGPYPVYGAGASEAMGSRQDSVQRETDHFRADRWPGADGGLVISTDHAGNPMILLPDGSVTLADHDAGWAEDVWPTFEAFLDWCMTQ